MKLVSLVSVSFLLAVLAAAPIAAKQIEQSSFNELKGVSLHSLNNCIEALRD
ncbi:MAG: hypothetical protein MK193_14515 [Lentisphaeria bacterium]|nr:hypothetical protein [Lentisphaeria bacterium]